MLIFGHDVLIDGRALDRPCNYALMPIRAPQGVAVDPAQRPVVVVDPRAGQAPGVGGSSSIPRSASPSAPATRSTSSGSSRSRSRARPWWTSGQRIRFLEEVIRRHPGAGNKPFVIGNCQAGWAVAALAAVRPELTGPVVLGGAPLSYSACADSQNPMRYNGGLFGGSWPVDFLADLGGGPLRRLARPELRVPGSRHTIWEKPYDLYSRMDTDAQTVLDFGRWWGGYYLVTKEEIREFVDNLFVGNGSPGGSSCRTGGRSISRTSPLRWSSSPRGATTSRPRGTALDWGRQPVAGHPGLGIVEYRPPSIVYLLDPDRRASGDLRRRRPGWPGRSAENWFDIEMDMLAEDLPPGLWGIGDRGDDPLARRTPQGHRPDGRYPVRSESRTMDDIRALNLDPPGPRPLFSAVEQVSEIIERLYQITGRPSGCRAPPGAQPMARLLPWATAFSPYRTPAVSLISDLNPSLAASALRSLSGSEQRTAIQPSTPRSLPPLEA